MNIAHTVTISAPSWLPLVTQKEWYELMGSNPASSRRMFRVRKRTPIGGTCQFVMRWLI